MDLNNDACISREEWIAKHGSDEGFDRCDLDHSGQIDLKEFIDASTRALRQAAGSVAEKYAELVTTNEVTGALHEQHTKLLADAGATYAELATKGFTSEDVLVVVDMQNDFLPAANAPLGGRFGVAEGAEASISIVPLIAACAAAGGKVIATRDYHPKNHCSFSTNGGAFPPHCIQGTAGSFFYEPIQQALMAAQKAYPGSVSVVYKGFAPQCDSFGGVSYSEEYYKERGLGVEPGTPVCGCAAVDWTGCFM